MSCSTLQKLMLAPGCRPWDKDPEAIPVIQYTEPVGPFLPTGSGNNEFAPVAFVQSSVSKVTTNLSRMFASNPTPQAQAQAIPWWNVTARISNAAGATNDALQSTMLKIIVVVMVVGVVAVFGMSYFQMKGANLAK